MSEVIEVSEAIPKEAIGALNGLYYKIGTHGAAFYWNGSEWRKSNKNATLVKSSINAHRHKFSFYNEG
tara:strand:+ start:1331 stop:1534 length:204 start_codon:yes stop_codon:yes gene_type:complete